MSFWNFKWFTNIFKTIKDDADKVAIAITQQVKKMLLNGVLGAIANVVDASLHTVLGAEVVTLLNNNINKILAVELAIQGLPDNPTAADIQTFEQSIITAVAGASAATTSKLYTVLAAQVYQLIETEVNKKQPIKFADLVSIVEQAYQDYLMDEQDKADTSE